MALNLWTDVSSIAQSVQQDAYFIVREAATMQNFVTVFTDMSGMNLRKSYKYNAGTALDVTDDDDLTSYAFTPSADQTLTPSEIALQFFITDQRAESDVPENIRQDAARELGFAAADKVQTDLIGELANLTGGTVGAAGSAMTWSYVAAAIAQARNANKSESVPLVCVMHEYQYAQIAKNASIAGATFGAVAPGFQEAATRNWEVPIFMGVPIYRVFGGVSSSTFTGGVFPRPSIAIDWRRSIRVEPERDASRRGWELNMSAIYAHGVWRPDLGICLAGTAAAPTGV